MSEHWSFELPASGESYVAFGAVAAFTFTIKNKIYSLVVDKIFCSSNGCVLSSNAGSIKVYGSRVTNISYNEEDRQCFWDEDADATNQERCFYRFSLSSREDLILYLDKFFDEWTCWLPIEEFNFVLRRKNKGSSIEIASQDLQWAPTEKIQEENQVETQEGQKEIENKSNQELSKTDPSSLPVSPSNTLVKQDVAGTYCSSGIILGVLCSILLLVGLCTNIPALSILGGVGVLACLAALIYGIYLYHRLSYRK